MFRKNMIEDHAISSAEETECFESTALKKRKIPAASPAKRKEPTPDLTLEDGLKTPSPLAKKKKATSSCKKKDEEKRSRRFRWHPPSSYLERLNRATTQRWAQNDKRSIGGSLWLLGCLLLTEPVAVLKRHPKRLSILLAPLAMSTQSPYVNHLVVLVLIA